jgi:hypothetical protein
MLSQIPRQMGQAISLVKKLLWLTRRNAGYVNSYIDLLSNRSTSSNLDKPKSLAYSTNASVFNQIIKTKTTKKQ